MTAFKLEDLEHIWDDKKESEKVSAYLYGAYTRLEKDFLAVLEYVPLREQHLSVSSSRFADFVLRTSPLINKTFRILTFGRGTLEKLEWETNPANSISMSSEDLFSIQKLLLEIHKKKKKNNDSISDYRKWFSNDLFYKLYQVNEDELIANPFFPDVKPLLIDNDYLKMEFKLFGYQFENEDKSMSAPNL